MASVTLTSLRARVRARADMTGSSFVADDATEVDAWINEANQQLHAMVVDAMGEEYVSSTSSFTTVSGTSDYNLPSGFYKLYGVDLNYHGNWRSLKRFETAERNTFRETHPETLPRYRLVGTKLRLYPATTDGLSGSILYAPEATVLSSGSDTVAYPNGWEQYIVLSAAMQALMKEESSVRDLSIERDKIERQIREVKENRDLATPRQTVDTTLVDFDPDLWLWR